MVTAVCFRLIAWLSVFLCSCEFLLLVGTESYEGHSNRKTKDHFENENQTQSLLSPCYPMRGYHVLLPLKPRGRMTGVTVCRLWRTLPCPQEGGRNIALFFFLIPLSNASSNSTQALKEKEKEKERMSIAVVNKNHLFKKYNIYWASLVCHVCETLEMQKLI